MTDDFDPEQALQQSAEKSRTDSEPAPTPDAEPDSPDLDTAVADAFDAIEAGDEHTTVSIRDEKLAALLRGLDASGELSGVVEKTATALDRDEPDVTTSDAVKLLVRAGLADVAPDTLDAGKRGYEEHLFRQATESDF